MSGMTNVDGCPMEVVGDDGVARMMRYEKRDFRGILLIKTRRSWRRVAWTWNFLSSE
jgi:hypothetical protein